MTIEKRSACLDGNFETREDSGKKYIEGYFAVFGAQYPLWDGAYETVDPGAFNLQRDLDVRALANHDTTLVLGRTSAGTLQLHVDDRGLYGTIEINEADQDAVNLYERVKRRDVTQCSFGFEILSEDIEHTQDYIAWHLREVKLYEVSVCTFPAYEATGVEARKAEFADIEKRKTESWRAEMLKRLKKE